MSRFEINVPVNSIDLVNRHCLSVIAELTIGFGKEPRDAVIPLFLANLRSDFKGKSGNGDFADAMVELDYRTGQVLDAIQEASIEDNTIVIWISDNGPNAPWPWMGDSGPFRGELGTAYEGAIRTPGIIKWPSKIEPGRVSNEIFAILDFFPTLANILGGKVPTDRPIDGIDQTDFIIRINGII